jgi:hypothetical protein
MHLILVVLGFELMAWCWKSVLRVLKKVKVELPYDPVI